MTATRIVVEWMTSVPECAETGESVYDRAQWGSKVFIDHDAARKFAEEKAARNPWRTAWVKTEHAHRADALEWQWVIDHDATEVIESDAA